MHYVIICTEGEVSEPAYLNALKLAVLGQTPGYETKVFIVTLPIGGNADHGEKLMMATDVAVEKCIQEELCFYDEDQDELEKWIVCDYDNAADINGMRQLAAERGYRLAVSKPMFEYFILLHFLDVNEAKYVKPRDYERVINEQIDIINEKNGWDKIRQLTIPHYSKNRFQAKACIEKLLCQMPMLVERIASNKCDIKSDKYSEMISLVQRIVKLHK
jgi:hypothetical protein